MRDARKKSQSEPALDFRWPVSVGGYRWVSSVVQRADSIPLPSIVVAEDDPLLQSAGVSRRRLLVAAPLGLEQTRDQRPLEKEPGLHRVLAAVRDSAGILAFAEKYGALGLKREAADLTHLTGRFAVVPGDSLTDWTTEIEALADAIEAWDSTKRGKNPSTVALDAVRAAMSPRLEDLRVVPRRTADHCALTLQLTPTSLCSAIWLQLAREVDGSHAILRCPQCREWFKFNPQRAKTPRRFCSQACRSKHYRGRRERAPDLYRQGIPIEAIADQLDSDVATVEHWLSRERGRRKPGSQRRRIPAGAR